MASGDPMLRWTSARLGPLIAFAMGVTGCGSGPKQTATSGPPVIETAPPVAEPEPAPPVAEPEPTPPDAAAGDGTIGLGAPGTLGKGAGAARPTRVPSVVPGTAQVRGALDKELIRRIVRRHINEVTFCYQKELVRKPDLYGRVMIQFTIGGSGNVIASVVQQSTMNNASVDQCIAGAVRRWEFPKPQGGGVVIVSYPFVLKSSGGGGQ